MLKSKLSGYVMSDGNTAVRQRILVAEDDPELKSIVTGIIESMGYHVDAVGNGEEAVNAASQQKYAMILLDGQMPVMGGLDATQRIRLSEGGKSNTPILGMSGDKLITKGKCLEAGMNGLLRKPFSVRFLQSTIQKYLAEKDKSDAA